MKKTLFFLFAIVIFFSCFSNVKANILLFDEDKLITEDDNIKKGGYSYVNEVISYNKDNAMICNDFYYADNIAIFCGYEMDSDGKRYPFVSLNKNNENIWIKTLYNFGEGEFRSLIVDGDVIVCAGTIGIEEGDILIVEYEMNGDEGEHRYYQTNGNSSVKKIYKKGFDYFIVGETTSNDGIFSDNIYSNNMIYIMVTDKYFVLKNISLIGNSGNNNVYQIASDKDNIYLYGIMRSTGEDSDGGQLNYVIIKYSYNTKIIKYIPADYMDGLISICSYDNKIFLINKKYEGGIIYFYELKQDNISLIYKINTGIKYDTNLDLLLAENSNGFIVYERVRENDKYYLYVTVFKNLEKTLTYKEELISGCRLLKAVCKDEKIIFLYNSDNKGAVCKTLIPINIINGKCYFNGIVVEGKSDTINNQYGYYKENIKYSYNNLVVVESVEKFNKPQINIKDGEIYDLNTEIISNGNLKINNELQENGYQITEEGIYLIELLGEGVSEFYTIKVKKMSISCSEILDYSNENLGVQFKEMYNDNDKNISVNYGDIEKINNVRDESGKKIIVILGLLCGVGIGIFILRLMKKRGKIKC